MVVCANILDFNYLKIMILILSNVIDFSSLQDTITRAAESQLFLGIIYVGKKCQTPV
jgi:hypothetical protein